MLRNEETCNIVNNAEIPARAAELLTEQVGHVFFYMQKKKGNGKFDWLDL